MGGANHSGSVHVLELGEIVLSRRPGRQSPDQITIGNLSGVGFQDTAITDLA